MKKLKKVYIILLFFNWSSRYELFKFILIFIYLCRIYKNFRFIFYLIIFLTYFLNTNIFIVNLSF